MTEKRSNESDSAVGEGKSRDEAIQVALRKLGLTGSVGVKTQVRVLQEGTYTLFGRCKKPWRIGVINLDAIDERKEQECQEERKRQEEKDAERTRRAEKKRRRPCDQFVTALEKGELDGVIDGIVIII